MINYLSSLSTNYIQNYRGLPTVCWLGISLIFIDALAGGIVFFLSLYFVGTLKIDITAAGAIISCYGIGKIVGGIIGGKLSDSFNPKLVLVMSLLIQSITYLLLVKLSSVGFLMINLFLMGISVYAFYTANDVWMLNQCKDRSEIKLKTINISRVALNLGFGLSGIIIGIFKNEEFNIIFYLSGVVLLLAAAYLAYQKSESIDVVEKDETKNIFQGKPGNVLVNKKIVILILACLFLMGLVLAQLSVTYPVYIKETFPQLGVRAVSILFILDTVLIVLFQVPLVNFLNRYNKIFVVGIGAFLIGLGMIILNFSSIFVLAIFSCIVWTTGEMLFMPMARLVFYEKGEQGKKGQSMGIFQSTFAVSGVSGPVVGGLIYQNFSGDALWYLSGVIGLFCFLACNYYKTND